ncbi:catechol 2,3-dioxygenase [Alkalihalobacillus xiaoxiensis]|uniref:Catechol 2,3-dioxygenase n=1 Tax=Shouchella xiaoxiensis TaxID=766895 RepID=A0ABS2SWP6_9BACI|nr:VOC family protein [Shouchella xiaoxiensis]MBM7838662.1 catechol 2,3-dioxygenase [Shouchella xiaoxiensis]
MIHEDSFLGEVTLIVKNIERSLDFYTETLGFQFSMIRPGEAVLFSNTETPLLILKEDKQAIEVPPNTYLGLYHFALLYPDRQSLGAQLKKLLELNVRIGGADHSVSEAIYLNDPDGNGIELYRDRPRTEWQYDQDNHVYMDTKALDIEGLLLEATEWKGLPDGVKMGHIHFHVDNLDQIEHFYKDILGFSVMTYFGRQALFMAAGGYHHHFGFNTWASKDIQQPKPAVGLELFTLNIPDERSFQELKERLERHQQEIIKHSNHSFSLVDPSFNRMKIKLVESKA